MFSYLSKGNLAYIEDLLEDYQNNPNSVEPTWKSFFDGIQFGENLGSQNKVSVSDIDIQFEIKVIKLIQGYRSMAYLIADVDPLNRAAKTHPFLELSHFGLTESDLDRTTLVGSLMGIADLTLKEIISQLRLFYASTVAVEIEHIEDPKARDWVQNRVEQKALLQPLNSTERKHTLSKLAQAEQFEKFLQKRFVGQKRFSVEGCDVLTPMLDRLINKAATLGADEFVMGMAHRGRLNVLANIFQKDLPSIYAEFLGNLQADVTAGDGDVKYHKGHSLDVKALNGSDVHLSMAPNPSHLEAVNTVVMGMVRAKQKDKSDNDQNKTWSVLMHGDASFSGQGIVYETLNMSNLNGYTVGGTIHIIINNQVGFTTDPKDSRSTVNPTDVAKMLQVPIFRVNADDVEACMRTMDLAAEFRQTFKEDVIIELVGYRRYGHNEGDEPSFTQPLLYKKIKAHQTVLNLYSEKLLQNNTLNQSEYQSILDQLEEHYEDSLEQAKNNTYSANMDSFGKNWSDFSIVPQDNSFFKPVDTSVDQKELENIAKQIVTVPSQVKILSKLKRVFDDKMQMVDGNKPFDWGTAELMAYGSLIKQGHSVRLAGQDAKRGTFSHRHSVLFDSSTNDEFIPLNHIEDAQGDYEVLNSNLSEYGALGYEFGQSWSTPKKLCIWEAQFGDFVNGAQIIIDQFITSSAIKWQRYSGLVMYLPHGYEGQGPEHSSARIERFLQACAQHNIQVCNLTTPAQIFHVLRRQILRNFRIPLIIATPKSLLRHPEAVSSWSDLSEGSFQEFIDDPKVELKKKAKRVILCSGKIYYELKTERDNLGLDIAIIRTEQFYPFHENMLRDILAQYKKLREVVWCQEEPQNMGGYWFMQQFLPGVLPSNVKFSYAGRYAKASPSNGYMHLHNERQMQIVHQALGK